jgi:hypothetical protein
LKQDPTPDSCPADAILPSQGARVVQLFVSSNQRPAFHVLPRAIPCHGAWNDTFVRDPASTFEVFKSSANGSLAREDPEGASEPRER